MAIDMDDLNREVMIDLKLGNDFRADVNQQKQIAHLTKHVRVLWHHVQRLEIQRERRDAHRHGRSQP